MGGDLLTSPGRLTRRQLLIGAVASGAVLSGPVAGPSRAVAVAANRVAGNPLYSYGHSYTMMPSPYVARPRYDEYQLVLGRRLGASQVVSRGRSGTPLVDTISAIIAPTFDSYRGRQWEVGTGNGAKTVLWHNMMNDVSTPVGGSSPYLAGYEAALRLGLGVFGSRGLLHASRPYATAGTWIPYRSELVAGGAMAYTRSYGATMRFLVSGDTCHVATLAAAASNPHGTFRVEVNGRNAGLYCNGTGRTVLRRDAITGRVRSWQPAGLRVTGMNRLAGTSGTKVLTIRRVEPAGSARPVFVNGVYLTSSTPPRVFVALEPPRNPAATSKVAVDAFYANQAAYRSLITRTCAQYNYVRVVDLAPNWDNSTMVSASDQRYGFHPNEIGCSASRTTSPRRSRAADCGCCSARSLGSPYPGR